MKNSKRHITFALGWLLWTGLLLPSIARAQVGVGTTLPHASAMMHIAPGAGNNKGLTVPSITSAQRMLLDSTQNIAQGLIFFDKDLQKFYYFHQGPKRWYELDHDWNRKDVPGSGFVVGTHIYSGVTGNVGIGTRSYVNPSAKLTVVGDMLVGNAAYTTAATMPNNSVSVQTWLGIGTRTRTSGYELDVKGQMRIKGTVMDPAALLVGTTMTAPRFNGTTNVNLNGEGMMEVGQIIMYYGTLTGNFVNGVGVGEYDGWALCDGRNNTPDLRGRFVVGSTNSSGNGPYVNTERNRPDYIVSDSVGRGIDSVGGLKEVVLTLDELPEHDHPGTVTSTDGAHNHSLQRPDGCYDLTLSGESGCYFAKPNDSFSTSSDGAHNHDANITSQGGGDAHENRPPYYTLAYIMKLP